LLVTLCNFCLVTISLEHQIYTDLFVEEPELTISFLRELGVSVPEYTSVERASCDLGSVQPTERRADGVLELRGPHPLSGHSESRLGVVLEVQRKESDRKRFTWPEYMATLRARLECPVALMVVCPNRATAAWCAEPIAMGHPGWTLHPIVVGPDQIPVITDPEEVRHRAALGVLSAVTHGDDDPRVPRALHDGLGSIAPEEARKYTEHTLLLLGRHGQRLLEELLKTETYRYSSDWTESLKAESRAEDILRLLTLRGVDIPEETRERISTCRDHDQLSTWFDRSVTITHIDELFAE
jgi:hypothetical protein